MQFKFLNLTAIALASSLSFNVQAAETDWAKIEQTAKGQTVYFNAWGGGENINRYLEWAAEQAKQRYDITVKHVKITDAAEVVKRIQTEQQAGRTTDGSVDLIWVNGENFSALKRGKLLYGPWAEQLPNWVNVDTKKPVQQDFSESTDGLEA
ncbi:MAG TPA: ABC transporter substrate-binding protein, partial [Thiolinea sp.]|nr:ABC transporter substrate-binding protein [Thiolinea sp.]